VATLFKSVLVVILGTLIGLSLTYFTLVRGFTFGTVKAGPWVGSPRAGSLEIDPYTRALLVRTGLIPLGAGEGVSLVAKTDSDNHALQGGCDTVLTGPMPPARYWTVSVFSPNGALIENADARYGFTSGEVLRNAGQPVEITFSSQAHPGNWLPVRADTAYVVVLRLYDSILSATAASLDASAMPKLIRGVCR